jgi:undecaprenyl-diphosphatase
MWSVDVKRRNLQLKIDPYLLDPIRASVLVVAWLVLAGVLIGMGELVVHTEAIQGFDNHVTSVVVAHRSPGLDAAMKAVTWLGSWVASAVAAGVVLLLVLSRRLPVGFLLLAIVVWGGTQGGTTLAKNVVQRSRPPEHLRLVSTHGWSWPSGHTTTAALVFTVMAFVVWKLWARTGPRLLAALAAALAVLAVGVSRVELGVHWTSDVLASMAFVAIWLVVAWFLYGSSVTSRSPQCDSPGSSVLSAGSTSGDRSAHGIHTGPRPDDAAGECTVFPGRY